MLRPQIVDWGRPQKERSLFRLANCFSEPRTYRRHFARPPCATVAKHRRCFVCAVVVDDQVQVEIMKRFTVDLFQEHQELLGAMAQQAFTDDLSGRHIERGEQRRGPVEN